MEVTLFGSVSFARLAQDEKAQFSMEVTPSGTVTSDSLVQPENAELLDRRDGFGDDIAAVGEVLGREDQLGFVLVEQDAAYVAGIHGIFWIDLKLGQAGAAGERGKLDARDMLRERDTGQAIAVGEGMPPMDVSAWGSVRSVSLLQL